MDGNQSNVFDVVYPSPIPLTELASIAVAIQLWHLDLNQYLENGNFSEEFADGWMAEPRITLRDVIPDIPMVIYQSTQKYLKMLLPSTRDWLVYHFDRIFEFDRDNYNVILKDFNDIVCDYDGNIDFVRTAKRMMLCDRISLDEKFKIACAYSLDEYIEQIWPSMQSKVDLNAVDFDHSPHLYYWVCYFRNEMDKVPNERNMPIDELMLEKTEADYRSSFEYFWNRVSPESRYRTAVTLCNNDDLSLCGRFVLPKLSEQQLTAFVAEKSGILVSFLWTHRNEIEHVFPIWMYIKDKMDGANFAYMIKNMLRCESEGHINYDLKWKTCCEIWKSAPEYMKKCAMKQILRYDDFYITSWSNPAIPKERRLLPIILSDATLQERTTFWHKTWSYLVISTRVSDLDRIMNLCFINKTEMEQFKTTTMAKYENLSEVIGKFIADGSFKELTDLLNFCCLDPQIGADLKRQILRFSFLDGEIDLGAKCIWDFQLVHDFIDDAYADSPELANDFRNQFVSSAGMKTCLEWNIGDGYLIRAKQFVESFKPIGLNVDQLKKQSAAILRDFVIESIGYPEEYHSTIDPEELEEFLLWCLGSDDRVIEFKKLIPSSSYRPKEL